MAAPLRLVAVEEDVPVEEDDWQSLKATERFVAEQPWKQVFPDAVKRMSMNGETQGQMAFAQKIREEAEDHSIDAPWEIDKRLISYDRYVLFTTALMMVPKCIVLAVPTFLLILPVVLAANWWGRTLPIPTDRYTAANYPAPGASCWTRARLRGRATRLLITPLFAFSVLLAALGLVYDQACVVVFGVPFWVCRGCPPLTQSMEAIRPFRGGPGLLRYIWRDVGLCLAGQSLRHGRCAEGGCCSHTRGAFRIAWDFTAMVLVLPTIKYWWNANYWVP